MHLRSSPDVSRGVVMSQLLNQPATCWGIYHSQTHLASKVSHTVGARVIAELLRPKLESVMEIHLTSGENLHLA